jgi:tetratricopeptide (TPR) repeat protein
MKRIVFAAVAVVLMTSVKAQSSKVVSANNYLKEYMRENDTVSLRKAKESIDLASENPDTKDLPKTQYYRGQIYFALFQSNLRTATEKSKDPDPKKKEAQGFVNVPVAELNTAYEAFSKAKVLDVKGNYTSELTKGINDVHIYFANKAIYDYNSKNYAAALSSFEKAFEITGSKDTLTLNNLAISAERAGNNEKAKEYYGKMAELKVGGPGTYIQLANTYLNLKDTTAGMETYKKGRSIYPNDINLLRNETDLYIRSNKMNEALSNLNQAIKAQPTDQILYFARGNMYDNLANPKDSKGKDLERPADWEEKLKMAEADYKKALELKPDYFDALYNLGALYYNNGVNLSNKANTISDQKRFEGEIKKANEEFTKAIPVLEKALSVNGKDVGTMTALKNIYYRMQMKEKGDAMKEKLND